jgi:hypothetical protein
MFKEEGYTYIETDEDITIKPKKPNERGFIVNVSYTKNQEEHEEAMEAIKEFFIREIF